MNDREESLCEIAYAGLMYIGFYRSQMSNLLMNTNNDIHWDKKD